MGQQEIWDVLREAPGRKFTVNKLIKVTGLSRNAVTNAVTKMANHEEIRCVLRKRRNTTGKERLCWLEPEEGKV